MTPTMTGLRPIRSERTPMRGPQTMAAAVKEGEMDALHEGAHVQLFGEVEGKEEEKAPVAHAADAGDDDEGEEAAVPEQAAEVSELLARARGLPVSSKRGPRRRSTAGA